MARENVSRKANAIPGENFNLVHHLFFCRLDFRAARRRSPTWPSSSGRLPGAFSSCSSCSSSSAVAAADDASEPNGLTTRPPTRPTRHVVKVIVANVSRLGDFLHFGQLLKACGNNYFAQIAHILGNFLKVSKSFIFGQHLKTFRAFY